MKSGSSSNEKTACVKHAAPTWHFELSTASSAIAVCPTSTTIAHGLGTASERETIGTFTGLWLLSRLLSASI